MSTHRQPTTVPTDSQPAPPSAVLAAVDQLATASEQAALVRLGLSSGLLVHCGEWVTLHDLAGTINAAETAVHDVCTALVAVGALQRDGDRVRLSTSWLPLAQGGLDVMLARTLDGSEVRRGLIGDALSAPPTYWELASEPRRALAESVTLATTTAFGRAAAHGIIAEIPGLDEQLAGVRWLELGCGVAGMLLGTLQHYPDMRAVGVDIAADLLDVARTRARELGVGDRVRFVACDARTYRDSEPFDLVFWSQFFFPAETRAETLRNAYARLRPGGMLVCPVLPADRTSLNALITNRWGVPAVSAEELAAEVTAAGFADPQQYQGDFASTVIARRGGFST